MAGNLTRINNNQITDAISGNVYFGINANTKVQPYSVTSTLLANNLTYGSDLTITGNLSVSGNVTAINTTNVTIEDPLLLLASNQSGSPTVDIGYIGQRGTSNNIAFVWDESLKSFVTVYTNSGAGDNTNITILSYADLITGNANVTGNLLIGGNISIGGNIVSPVNISGNITVGNIATTGQISAVGNITTANYFIGDGYYISNINPGNVSTTKIANGNSSANIGTPAGNLVVTIANTLVSTFYNNGVNFTGNTSTTGTVSAGNIVAVTDVSALGNVVSNNAVNAVSLSLSGNVTSALNVTDTVTANNVNAVNNVSATGNVYAANFATTGSGGNISGANVVSSVTFTATGNIYGATVLTTGQVSAVGNIQTANYFIGDGYYISNINPGNVSTTKITNGGSYANVTSASGNVVIAVGASSNVAATFYDTGVNFSGPVSVQGNVTTNAAVNANTLSLSGNVTSTLNVTTNVNAGNLSTSGFISATGTATVGNISTIGFVTATGNVNGGNIIAATDVSAGGNVIGGNILTVGLMSATGNLLTNANLSVAGNAVIVGNLQVQGNITFIDSNVIVTNDLYIELANNQSSYANINNAGLAVGPVGSPLTYWQYQNSSNAWSTNVGISATANITSGNLITAGFVTAIGNIQTANYFIGDGYYISNINPGNVSTTKIVSGGSYANVTSASGNVVIAVGASSNVAATFYDTGVNFTGLVSVQGNVSVSDTVTTGTLNTSTLSASGTTTTTGINDNSYISTTGNITGDVITGNTVNTGTLSASGTTTTTGINDNGNISTSGNVTAANFTTSGSQGNITGANVISAVTITATGNVGAGSYLFGDGAYISNINAANVSSTKISNGGSYANIASVDGNLVIAIGAGSNVAATFYDNGVDFGGNISAVGNVAGGNIVAVGNVYLPNDTAVSWAYGSYIQESGVSHALSVVGGTALSLQSTGNVDLTSNSNTATLDTTGNLTLPFNLIGQYANFSQPNFIQPVAGDTNWSYGVTTSPSGVWMQTQFNGGQTTHGFRVYDNYASTYPFVVDGDGNVTATTQLVTPTVTSSSDLLNIGTAGNTAVAINGTIANLVYVSNTDNAVAIGSNLVTTGATLAINATDSMLLPVGNTSQRPVTTTTGMLRYNSTVSQCEVWNGAAWVAVGGSTYTVIQNEQFDGDGTTVSFTLGSSQTTDSCIVTINGIVQIPTTAYSVSGVYPSCVLTFTEAPVVGDTIDVREITTTTSVTAISNSTGNSVVSVKETTGEVDITGNLVAQLNAAAPSLSANSTMTFQLVNNTTLSILVRGTDGVTRHANITLS
jgi:filamentous hemagglutinin